MADQKPQENPLIPEPDAIFDMSAPEFQVVENDWIFDIEASALPADGSVLYLNQLLLNNESSVLIKSSPEEAVHLIVDSPLVSSDVVIFAPHEFDTARVSHHYYEFPNDLKVYSEHSLSLIHI